MPKKKIGIKPKAIYQGLNKRFKKPWLLVIDNLDVNLTKPNKDRKQSTHGGSTGRGSGHGKNTKSRRREGRV